MRKNTQLESAGADFFVLGQLLIEGISAYKSYQNFKGYDIIAVNPEENLFARILIKSRYQTSWDGFIIKNFECDFVVLITLKQRIYKAWKKWRLREKTTLIYATNEKRREVERIKKVEKLICLKKNDHKCGRFFIVKDPISL